MNQELAGILLSIHQIDGITKGAICSALPKRLCRVNCNVCPLGYIPIISGDNLHYLKHLIAIREKVNI